METRVQRQLPESFEIRRWEFNALLLEALLFAGVAAGLALGLTWSKGLAAILPQPVSFGIMLFLIGLSSFPIESILVRTRYGAKASISHTAVWSAVGAATGALLFAFLRR